MIPFSIDDENLVRMIAEQCARLAPIKDSVQNAIAAWWWEMPDEKRMIIVKECIKEWLAGFEKTTDGIKEMTE